VPQASQQTADAACHLHRFVDFAEPRPDDTCLDVAHGASVLASAIGPKVRDVVSAGTGPLPAGPFTLVTARLTLARSADPVGMLREMLRVCRGRLVVADLVRTRAGDGSRIAQLRDPAHTAMRTLPELTELVRRAGGEIRRLDVFTIERPIEPWLAQAREPDRIRQELAAELDGGPRTGARPRLIGRELWFAQSWAYIAAAPVSPRPSAAAPQRR
jgi:hypothetical protein